MPAHVPGLRERIVAEFQRVAAGRSVLAFAKEHGFTQQQANDWLSENKSGTPSVENIQRLAKVFGVTWQWLLVGDPYPRALDDPAHALHSQDTMTPELANALVLVRRVYAQSAQLGDGEAWRALQSNLSVFSKYQPPPPEAHEQSAESAPQVTPPVTARGAARGLARRRR